MNEYLSGDGKSEKPREKIINAPGVVVGLIAVMVVIHVIRVWLPEYIDEWILLTFSFSPARYWPAEALQGLVFPGGVAGQVWSLVSHSLLHANWTHLLFNCAWLLVFGTILARRIGAWRFLGFSAATAAVGALAYLAVNFSHFSILIGASGAISGQMAAATRLMFANSFNWHHVDEEAMLRLTPLTIVGMFRHPMALAFLGVWLALTLIFAAPGFNVASESGTVAWEAHIGGFVAGLLLFSLFDRRKIIC